MISYFDVHTHIQDTRIAKPLSVIEKANDFGVKYVVACSTSEADWLRTINLADRSSRIIPSLGIHPWFLDKLSANWYKKLMNHLENRVMAVGECGLDFATGKCDRNTQVNVCRKQLQLAYDMGVPVTLHCVKAFDAIFALLREFGRFKAGGIIHSYSGSADMIPLFIAFGFSISYSAEVQNINNKKVRNALIATPQNNLFFETDSPDQLSFKRMEDGEKINLPQFLPDIVTAAAKIVGNDPTLLADTVFDNCMRLFAVK